MFSWYHAYRIEKQRRDEEAAYAAEERLMKAGGTPRGSELEKGAVIYHHILHRLGGLLVLWGRRMQAGYEGWAAFQSEEASLMQKPGPCS